MRRERFTAVPIRVDEAIDSGALDPHLGNLLKRLIYRCGKKHETVFVLDELAGWLRGWEYSTETLRQYIRKLEELGWIELESPGKGAPRKGESNVWHAALTGALLVPVGDALEFNSNGEGDADGGTRHQIGGSAPPGIPTLGDGSGSSVDADADADVDVRTTAVGLRRLGQSVKGASTALELLVAEVADADDKTLTTFVKNFGPNAFTEFQLVYVKQKLKWRRTPAARKKHGGPLRSEAAYVYDLLNNVDAYMAEDAV